VAAPAHAAGVRDLRRVGIVGAGQLARMILPAATALDVPVTVLAAGPEDAAVRAGARAVFGSPDDLGALEALAERSDVLTFDHEVIPPRHLRALEDAGRVLRPPPHANLFAQDKAHQRRGLADAGLPVPAFAVASAPDEIVAFGEERGWPVVAKRPRGGYDGRGVWVLDGPASARAAWQAAGGPLLVEDHVELERELAVLVARRLGGEAVAYPPVETVQQGGMLRESLAPAPGGEGVGARAAELGLRVAGLVGAVGILAVELFVTRGGRLLVNELALRPHNSGHWTIEGAATSQFENHLRAVLDWPLGSTEARAPAVATVNVVGGPDGRDPREALGTALAVAGAHVHLYGKTPRAGRKLGHVTALGADAEAARAVARRAARALGDGG
jgi:5-(carboxyamino)imidazole ribonucleotide synthase